MDYDFRNDWRLLKSKNMFPKEIVGFLEDVFQIMEIRRSVGTVRGIKFEVRSREQHHNKTHVHAAYGDYNISICIDTGEILAGNLPPKQQRMAVEWVKKNRDRLLDEWAKIVFTATSITTKSRME